MRGTHHFGCQAAADALVVRDNHRRAVRVIGRDRALAARSGGRANVRGRHRAGLRGKQQHAEHPDKTRTDHHDSEPRCLPALRPMPCSDGDCSGEATSMGHSVPSLTALAAHFGMAPPPSTSQPGLKPTLTTEIVEIALASTSQAANKTPEAGSGSHLSLLGTAAQRATDVVQRAPGPRLRARQKRVLRFRLTPLRSRRTPPLSLCASETSPAIRRFALLRWRYGRARISWM